MAQFLNKDREREKDMMRRCLKNDLKLFQICIKSISKTRRARVFKMVSKVFQKRFCDVQN